MRYEGKPYRRLRVDAMAEEKLTRAEKAHLRFIRRVRRALEEEAVASLKRAKRGHDALEALYQPCVDFDAVDALCDAEIASAPTRCDGKSHKERSLRAAQAPAVLI